MYELVAIRLMPSEDGSHQHIEVVGYDSGHMPGEAIMIPPGRIVQRQALGERFWVVVDGEKVDIQGGTCPQCGFEPHLTTAQGDAPIMALPKK